MSVYKIGSLLRYERENNNITRERLCAGLCTSPMLFKIEENKGETDKLLLDMLFQRLGKSPDKLEIILSVEEYNKLRARDIIERLILKNKWVKAEYLLNWYLEQYGECTTVHQMYYYRARAYILLKQGNPDEAFNCMEEALEMTMPAWKDKPLSEYCISTYEMENLLVYGVILKSKGSIDAARKHIDNCIRYIKQYFTDIEEFRKIYPKCVWILSSLYDMPQDDEMITGLCEEALLHLRKGAIVHFMIPIMKEIIFRYERMNKTDRAAYWKRYYVVLNELYEIIEPDVQYDSLYFNPYQCEINLDYEVIKGERLSKGLTQEKVIEEIYASAEPLSRMENGKASPRKKTLDAFMDKFDIEKSRYNTFMVTQSFKILEMKDELDYYISVYDIQNANKKISEIEKHLDYSIADNRRFLENIKNIIARLLGNITEDEALKRAMALLKESYDYKINVNRPAMRNEAVLIVQVATILNGLGKSEEAYEILDHALRIYQHSKVAPKYRSRSYMVVSGNFERLLYDTANIDMSNAYTKIRMRKELEIGKGRLLEQGMTILACNIIDASGEEEIYKSTYKKAYILGCLFLEKYVCSELEEYYCNKYGTDIKKETLCNP